MSQWSQHHAVAWFFITILLVTPPWMIGELGCVYEIVQPKTNWKAFSIYMAIWASSLLLINFMGKILYP